MINAAKDNDIELDKDTLNDIAVTYQVLDSGDDKDFRDRVYTAVSEKSLLKGLTDDQVRQLDEERTRVGTLSGKGDFISAIAAASNIQKAMRLKCKESREAREMARNFGVIIEGGDGASDAMDKYILDCPGNGLDSDQLKALVGNRIAADLESKNVEMPGNVTTMIDEAIRRLSDKHSESQSASSGVGLSSAILLERATNELAYQQQEGDDGNTIIATQELIEAAVNYHGTEARESAGQLSAKTTALVISKMKEVGIGDAESIKLLGASEKLKREVSPERARESEEAGQQAIAEAKAAAAAKKTAAANMTSAEGG